MLRQEIQYSLSITTKLEQVASNVHGLAPYTTAGIRLEDFVWITAEVTSHTATTKLSI